MCTQQLNDIIVRVAHMNNTWQITLTGQLEMGAKDAALHIARREHAKIVKPELPDCHNFSFMCQFAQLRANLICICSSIVRVYTYTREDGAWMCFRQCHSMLARNEVATRINHTTHTTRHRSLDHSFAIS